MLKSKDYFEILGAIKEISESISESQKKLLTLEKKINEINQKNENDNITVIKPKKPLPPRLNFGNIVKVYLRKDNDFYIENFTDRKELNKALEERVNKEWNNPNSEFKNLRDEIEIDYNKKNKIYKEALNNLKDNNLKDTTTNNNNNNQNYITIIRTIVILISILFYIFFW